MKYNKVLSITLTNGLLLLAFASILASCQKKSIHKNGLFSQFEVTDQSRGIASISRNELNSKIAHNFVKFQDPKQITIYCSLNSINVKQCYKRKLNKTLKSFIQTSGAMTKAEFDSLKNTFDFNKTNTHVQKIKQRIKFQLSPKILALVNKRKSFCENNSKINFKRCLNQYVERDTFAVLNAFQMKQAKMNGHEYLYLKKIIQKSFKEKFTSIKRKI